MARYYAELYATITSDEKVFSAEKLISFSDPVVKTRMILIPYDPARRHDRSATLCVRMGDAIDGSPHLHIYKEKDIRGSFPEQKKELFDIRQEEQKTNNNVQIAIDATITGTVVAEMMGMFIDHKIYYTVGNGPPKYNKEFGTWQYAKKNLVSDCRTLIEAGFITCDPGLT